MFRQWLAKRVVSATLKQAALTIETAAAELDQPWAHDLAQQLRVLAQQVINFRK